MTRATGGELDESPSALDAAPSPGVGWGRAGLAVAASTMAANLLGYALVLVLTRTLTPGELGAVGALFNLVVIGTVPALSVQLVAASRTARSLHRSPGGPAGASLTLLNRLDRLQPTVLGAAVLLGATLGAIVLLASPLLAAVLHLDGVLPAVFLAAGLLPTTLTYGVQGLLQGRERFAALSVVFVLAAGVRFAAGALAGLLGWGTTGVMAATAVGAWVAAGAALAVLRPAWRPAPDRTAVVRVLRQVVGAGVSTAGLLTLFNIDLLLARYVLPAQESGVYAVGSLFAKGAFWGPQFVATLLFPHMATLARRDRAVVRGVVATAGIGVLVVAAAAGAGELLVQLVAGERYAVLASQVWIFVALGGTLAVVQVLVYAGLAVGDRRLAVVAWGVVAAVCAAVLGTPGQSVPGVAGTALGGAAALVAAGLVLERAAFKRRPA